MSSKNTSEGQYLLLKEAAKHAVAAKPEHLGRQTRLAGTPALTCENGESREKKTGVIIGSWILS